MIIASLIIFGLALGSFVNALVWRLRMQDKSKSKKAKASYSISKGRSMCVECRHVLAPKDLMPLFSWLSLGGKCRYCKCKISWQYPLVEATTALLFVVSYLLWPFELQNTQQVVYFILWLIHIVGFVALTIYDLRWMELPNEIVFTLLGFVVAYTLFLAIDQASFKPLLQAAYGFGAIGGVFYLLFMISDGKWIGGGDVKLGFLIGILLASPISSLGVIFIASLLGTITLIPIFALGKYHKNMKLPFGPFLLLATSIMVLFGDKIIDYYFKTF